MIELKGVTRTYGSTGTAGATASGGSPVDAVRSCHLHVRRGETVALTGPSGCGKSTLLHLAAGLDRPTEGSVVVAGLSLHDASEQELTAFRREQIGIVFQFFNLMPAMTVLENVALPLLLRGGRAGAANAAAAAVLELVGLQARAGHFPHQLSGGEAQRTAIARAVVHEPPVLLADEPTGNLDSASQQNVLEVLARTASQREMTMLIVTHSDEVAATASRVVPMRDGTIIS